MSNPIRHPEFVLALDAEYVRQLFPRALTLDPHPMWYLLEGGCHWLDDSEPPESPAISRALSIRQRESLENDTRCVLPVPYTVLACRDEAGEVTVATYHRSQAQEGAREDGAMSIGWDSPIEVEDIAFTDRYDIDFARTVENSIYRVLQKELLFEHRGEGGEVDIGDVIERAGGIVPMGFVNDMSDDAGRSRLAIVSLIVVPADIGMRKRVDGHLAGSLQTIEALGQDLAKFERWSKAVIEASIKVVKDPDGSEEVAAMLPKVVEQVTFSQQTSRQLDVAHS